jgi:glycosyltransferase involved in cell wall biosynthesis
VGEECARLGIQLPRGHSHRPNPKRFRKELEEYELADALLCPSDFVRQTFASKGYPESKLVRSRYGFDPSRFPAQAAPMTDHPTFLFMGRCEPRKGLHLALRAWLSSSASWRGTFKICGRFVPGYAELLADALRHRSVEYHGFVQDVPSVMGRAQVFVLPSIEEGSALVTYEARACGCVLLVSDASGAPCRHMVDGLVHQARDVEELTRHMTALVEDRELFERLRIESINHLEEITWSSAAERLAEIYDEVIRRHRASAGASA